MQPQAIVVGAEELFQMLGKLVEIRILVAVDFLLFKVFIKLSQAALACAVNYSAWCRWRQTFEVTHAHHPLRGQQFKLVTYRHNWGEDRVYFHDSSRVLRSIPACWTTVLPADPFVLMAAGRCLFRYEDLLKLADLVEKAR